MINSVTETSTPKKKSTFESLDLKKLDNASSKELIKIIIHLTNLIDVNLKNIFEEVEEIKTVLYKPKFPYNSYLSIDNICDDHKPT